MVVLQLFEFLRNIGSFSLSFLPGTLSVLLQVFCTFDREQFHQRRIGVTHLLHLIH